jgi:hypothetical protein
MDHSRVPVVEVGGIAAKKSDSASRWNISARACD